MSKEKQQEMKQGMKHEKQQEMKQGMKHEKQQEMKQGMKHEEQQETKQETKQEMKLVMDARSENEALARMCTAVFLTRLHPTLEEMEDVKTAVSEAVTNAIIHGMPKDGKVYITCSCEGDIFHVEIEDYGVGIENIKKAMEPLYTTKPEQERSGMGFAFMEAFMDELHVISQPGQGTRIVMEKSIGFSRDKE